MTEEQIRKAEIASVAKELRTHYAHYRQIRDRRPYRPSKRFDSISAWTQAAELVLRLQADPEEFIAAQFKMRMGPVFANTLHGDAAQRAWKNAQYAAAQSASDSAVEVNVDLDPTIKHAPTVVETAQRVVTMQSMLEAKLGTAKPTAEEAVKTILETPWLFDPLIVMCVYGSDSHIRAEFKAAAVEDLANNPVFRRAAKQLNISLKYIDEDY